MTENTPAHVRPLNYASPAPPREASRRRMFLYLLPGAICVGALVGSCMIEATFPKGDSRDVGGPMCVLVSALPGLVFGVMGIREAFRPLGLRALAWGVGWNIVIALGPWIALWIVVKFGLLKRA